MVALLAPVLAQLVTLSLGDRAEARYVATDVPGEPKHFEGATYPNASLRFGWKRGELSLGYGASLIVTPLESSPRNVEIFHNAQLSAAYRWKRTTLTLGEAAGYGERNFARDALGTTGTTPSTDPAPTNPTTPTGPDPAPTAPTGPSGQVTNPTGVAPGVTRYQSFVTSLSLTHQLDRATTLNADATYSLSGGVGAAARTSYPLVASEGLSLSANNQLGRYWQVSSLLSLQHAFSPRLPAVPYTTDSVLAAASETLSHRFGVRAGGQFGAGLAMTRREQSNGLTAYSVFPTFTLSAGTGVTLERGVFTVQGGIGATPVLDPLTATVDPRLTLTSGFGWSRDRFSASANLSAALSLGAEEDRGRINSTNAALTAAYQVADALGVDGGVRAAWQTFEGRTVLPPSWALFAGATFNVDIPSHH